MGPDFDESQEDQYAVDLRESQFSRKKQLVIEETPDKEFESDKNKVKKYNTMDYGDDYKHNSDAL